MAIVAKKQSPWLVILILIAAVALWGFEQTEKFSQRQENRPPQSSAPAAPAGAKIERQNNYEVYRSCTLVSDRSNDGDSFRVRLPDGREEILRLYFVDTPESAFKSYRGGDTNHPRIAEQARDLRTTPERAVEIGQQAKRFTLDLLEKSPFTLYTRWDSPFRDQRYHAFIQVPSEGKPRWLHELLLENGLARLKTKPADLPDGTPASQHRQHLQELLKQAMQRKTGVWAD